MVNREHVQVWTCLKSSDHAYEVFKHLRAHALSPCGSLSDQRTRRAISAQEGGPHPLLKADLCGVALASERAILGCMNRRFLSVTVVTSLMVLSPRVAMAVCFDPATGLSGYRIPLDVKTRRSPAIVIGRVTSERALREDASDPDDTTGYIYTFSVIRQLKGNVPPLITLRAQNDSGGYRMSVGEQHLLFLQKPVRYFEADNCGNASELPRGNAIVRKVETLLARKAKAP